IRSERWMTPGMYSRPAEPMPLTRPNLAPLALTHSGPFGPSMTWGMRSFIAADALLVNRSGGSQIRSTWPSAEITSYFMGLSSWTSIFLPSGAATQDGQRDAAQDRGRCDHQAVRKRFGQQNHTAQCGNCRHAELNHGGRCGGERG